MKVAEDWCSKEGQTAGRDRRQSLIVQHKPGRWGGSVLVKSAGGFSGRTKLPGCVFTYAGLSSSMRAVVESGSKSRFFLTFCLGDVGLPGPALPLFVSYSWQQQGEGDGDGNYTGVTGNSRTLAKHLHSEGNAAYSAVEQRSMATSQNTAQA